MSFSTGLTIENGTTYKTKKTMKNIPASSALRLLSPFSVSGCRILFISSSLTGQRLACPWLLVNLTKKRIYLSME